MATLISEGGRMMRWQNCNCHQTIWHYVGPIPPCPVHDLCGDRGCGCGRKACPVRSRRLGR